MSFLRAFLLFVILLALALLLGQAGTGTPIPVSLQLGTLQLQTTAPVAITLAIAVLLLAFYAGRLAGWLIRLPNRLHRRQKTAVTAALADAYAAFALADLPAVTRHLNAVKPQDEAQADLANLLSLQTATLSTHQVQKLLENPRLAALAAISLARGAALQANWAEVRRVTIIGRRHAPQNLSLLTLQFKALVNLNDPATSELLPTLKPILGAERQKLLTQIIQGPNAITARPMLDSHWVRAIQAWLPTPSDVFPADETAA